MKLVIWTCYKKLANYAKSDKLLLHGPGVETVRSSKLYFAPASYRMCSRRPQGRQDNYGVGSSLTYM